MGGMIYPTSNATMLQTNRLWRLSVVDAVGCLGELGMEQRNALVGCQGASFKAIASPCVSGTTHSTNRENSFWIRQSVVSGH